jgi:hypothetical protein
VSDGPPIETVSIDEAAATLGVPLEIMRALLKHQRVTGAYELDDEHWLIPRASVEAFAAERAAEQTPD